MNEAYRILIIDDNPDSHADFRRILVAEESIASHLAGAEAERAGRTLVELDWPRFELDCVLQGEEGLVRVVQARQAGRPYAVAFVNMGRPPACDGIETIRRLWEADPSLEVVICTAFSGYAARDLALPLRRSRKLLLLKKPLDNIEVQQLALSLAEKWGLARAAQSSFEHLETQVKDRTREAEQALALIRASEHQYRLLFESNPTPIFTYDQSTLAFVTVNEAAVRHYGYSKEEFLKLTLRDIALPEDLGPFLEKLSRLSPGAGNSGVWRHRTKSGKLTVMEMTTHQLGPQKIVLSLAIDVTERLSLEAQLRQSQKMESIGQLAGGIAHDFNNLLTVINGHASLLLAGEKLTPKCADSLKEIVGAGKRAGALTRQLMTFSRKQQFHPQAVDLNEVVNNVTKMLRRILGEDVTLDVDFSPGLPAIKADLGMIEQVLLNLAVNSRDAMPRGGRLQISTAAVTIDAERARLNPEAVEGHFVSLTFADTGCGIAPENVGRIFEPFYTTKELDRGTGLGLATVYGIVKQHQGWITVRSRVGEGTTFEIFLPSSAGKSGALQRVPGEQTVIGGTETILVVEDESPLLKLIRHILESQGYKVLDSTNGREALAVWEGHRKRIDLLLTDLILPDGMAGTELAKILQTAKPGLKVLYTSGYDAERLAREFPQGIPPNLVQKPFHARKLAEMVYEILNAKT
jgi:two-component system, cell cycle sensor histidine kinase and response regulator CckA